jgi:hypothetical protein
VNIFTFNCSSCVSIVLTAIRVTRISHSGNFLIRMHADLHDMFQIMSNMSNGDLFHMEDNPLATGQAMLNACQMSRDHSVNPINCC